MEITSETIFLLVHSAEKPPVATAAHDLDFPLSAVLPPGNPTAVKGKTPKDERYGSRWPS